MRQHGNMRTRCVLDIPSCLRMKVHDLVIEYLMTVECACDCMHICV